jgi:SAM-dependent methyltransferase
MAAGPLRLAARRTIPLATRTRLVRRYRRLTAWPPIGLVRFGSLRRGTPFTRNFGGDRGTPLDRHYIEDFLSRHAGLPGYSPGTIRGRVLEIGEDVYSRRYGRPGDIERLDVLDVSPANPRATVVADLTDGSNLASGAYDCIICAQTLLLIYDLRAVVATLHRILAPGGTLLVTLPGISQICRPDMDEWGDYWRFTTLSARRLFEEAFEPADITVEAYGNVLAATAFLYGLAAEDVRPRELDLRDPDYQVTIGVKAVKRGQSSGAPEADTVP